MTSEHIDVRQHILDTAKPIILGKGFSAVGLTEILSAAAVPKGSFYHYFKSKEAFGEALLEDYFANYCQRLDEIFNVQGSNAGERMLAYWGSWLETQSCDDRDGQCLTVKLAAEVSDLSESMRGSLVRGTQQLLARIAQCLSEGEQDGSIPHFASTEQTALHLYEIWLGATLLTKIRRDRSALESAMLSTKSILGVSPS
ncbi:TetR/AcrR family transcriptional regulator [Deefgea salmonis]|uniref:TetR/AcrR family transcriptional regulator n=1 Tax=Deefgea salmonis TaxID=2875502 RepID=A0ABS8BLQ4_9NEIS|nr:TetR/AcrR family transcriptional regulator [Deefgea salmonis]MCB5196629.1 TetR/AcrR family transcriptional regulator [Deefgea salmonis]